MKKTLLTCIALSIFCILLKAQDTMFVHKIDTAKFIFFSDGSKVPNTYPDTLSVFFLNRVDSVTFLKNTAGVFDTLNIKYNHKSSIEYNAFLPSGYNAKIPFGKIDSVTFSRADTADYKTISGFDLLTDAAYRPSKYWYGKEDGMGMSEMGTDIWTAGSETYAATSGIVGDNRSLILYQNFSPSNSNVTRQWIQLYTGVNLCNLGIKIANDNNFVSSDQRALRKSELHFLRAFYYWHIVETWGGVHLTETPYYTPNLKALRNPIPVLIPDAKRTAVSAFYDLMIADLLKAIDGLPDNASEYGKVTKPAAKAFLARVYLTAGKNQLAKQLADEVIASGKFSLLPKYTDLWDMMNLKNNEVIWAIDYKEPAVETDVYNDITNRYGYGFDIFSIIGNPTSNRGNNNSHALFISRYDLASTILENRVILNRDVRNGWSFARFKPTKFLLNLYDETKDSRYKGSFQTVWKMNRIVTVGRLRGKVPYLDTALVITKNAKPNLNYYSINTDTLYAANGGSIGTSGFQNALFPSLLKFQDSTRSASPNDLGSGNIQSKRDVFVIRLAEMYLIAAEASLNTGDISGAKNYLDILRIKRAIPGKENDMPVLASDINIDFILDERAREFAGEQIRWFDLKRTGKLIERVKKYNPDAGASIQDYHVLRPIPKVQLDFTPGLIQNTGY